MFLAFEIIAFELVKVNSPYYDENTRLRQSTSIRVNKHS